MMDDEKEQKAMGFDLRGVIAVHEADKQINGMWKEAYGVACDNAREREAFRSATPTDLSVERAAREVFVRKATHLLSLIYDDTLIERLAEKAHDGWMTSKREQGITSRLSESGEEFMAPYADLSESAKELDRSTVRSVVEDIRAIMRAIT